MTRKHNSRRAVLIATLLRRAWRLSPQALSLKVDELEEIASLLLGSGAGALAWWRIRATRLCASRAARKLHEAYRLHTINVALYGDKIKRAFILLRAHKIEPVLIKGWANARLYPEAGLRPYGDIDLCVEPSRYAQAVSVLESPDGKDCWVDLHRGTGRLDKRGWRELYERSQLVCLDDVDVRVLGAEDHLRLLSIHLLRHGAWRPIWLCDVAVCVESLSDQFDWNVCLGRDGRRAEWVAATINLAHQLLGARLEHCPQVVRDIRLPIWLIRNVLRQWATPMIKDHGPPELMMRSLRRPARVPGALLARWPNPIEATIRREGAINRLPRFPYQLSDFLARGASFLTRLPKWLREY
jgi:hypothetical protein